MKIIKNILIVVSIFFIGCNKHKYKYKISGDVKSTVKKVYFFTGNNIKTFNKAIAYTDTIYGQNNDSIWYYNSNGSKVTIFSPYIIKFLK